MNKLIYISLIIYFCSFSILVFPENYNTIDDSTMQSKKIERNNLFFFEIGGNGLFLSLNYERYISDNLSIRVGWGNDIFKGSYIPLLINYNFEQPWELGIGIVSYNFPLGHRTDKIFASKSSGVLITSNAGFKKKFDWFLLKISVTPLYNPDGSVFQLFGGLSVGISF
ncbi:MAG TPA: hypothetical protein VKA26_11410 [Ignavibacteriaceae bacterium]|nr:hypothetical protein [Ignavibacteriaceae bacterium]